MKKVFLGLLALQLLFSCSKDAETVTEETLVTDLLNAPYASLTPEQQKLKLEAEAKSSLNELEKTKTSSSIEAMQNLDRLLKLNAIDILNGKADNGIQEALNLSDAYGTYTWNNSFQRWDKTASTANLTFKFPSTKTGTVNNTELTTTAVSSTVQVEIVDTPLRYQWTYDPTTGYYENVLISQEVLDNLYLPTSVDGKLKINEIETASITLKNTFANGKEVPVTSDFKLSMSDGYALEIKNNRQSNPTASASFTYNDKNILSYTADSTAKVDELLEDYELTAYYGKATLLVSILDNFAIVGNGDIENFAIEQDKIDASIISPNYYSSTYYTLKNANRKKESELTAEAYNKYNKIALVSKKDKTKIADIITKSELDYSYYIPEVWQNNQWEYSFGGATQRVDYYEEVLYLKFNDNTEVAMNVYFSTGFDSLETQIEDFVNAFNR